MNTFEFIALTNMVDKQVERPNQSGRYQINILYKGDIMAIMRPEGLIAATTSAAKEVLRDHSQTLKSLIKGIYLEDIVLKVKVFSKDNFEKSFWVEEA